MTASKWYVRENFDTSRALGTIIAHSIDVALGLARMKWGHQVAVSDMPKAAQSCRITYHPSKE